VHVAANQHVQELKLSEGAKSHTFEERMYQRLQREKGMLGKYRNSMTSLFLKFAGSPLVMGGGLTQWTRRQELRL
jgi:hypothetical protein